MTCVLSVTSLYNNPCTSGCNKDGDRISGTVNEDYSYDWINGVNPCSGQVQTLGFVEGSSPSICRVEAVQGGVTSGTLLTNISGSRCGTTSAGMCNLTPADGTTRDGQSVTPELKRKFDSSKEDALNHGKRDAKRARQQEIVIPVKRKLEIDTFDEIYVPPKRISPFLNTPKERKDERKKILKMSIQKLKKVEDPEHFLRRSVLINNTMKRMQSELREEKKKSPKSYGYKRRPHFGYGYDILNNNCLSNSYLYDDPFLSGVHEKITDDMTDTLMNNLKDRLGGGSVSDNDKSVTLSSVPESNSVDNQSDTVVNHSPGISLESIDNVPSTTHEGCDDLDVIDNSQRNSAYLNHSNSAIDDTDSQLNNASNESERIASAPEKLTVTQDCSIVSTASSDSISENHFALQGCDFDLKTAQSFMHSTSDRVNVNHHRGSSLSESHADTMLSGIIRAFGET